MTDALLSPATVAEKLAISVRTLKRDVKLGKSPVMPVQWRPRWRFKASDVERELALMTSERAQRIERQMARKGGGSSVIS